MKPHALVYENKYCKVTWKEGNYILQSKSGKYTDKYYRDLQEVSHATGIPVKDLCNYNPYPYEKG